MSSELPPPNLDVDENLSTTSSSSSFVPIDQQHIQDAIQIINENKEFNSNILTYINKVTPSSINNNYHIISVFGSQSTGKSTLLNKLFNTNFDVMDELSRQQTTRGIWMAYSPSISTSNQVVKNPENIFVMDVEGTDGRERGEDQDFERKAALFALSTSEILIINIWEYQIGLYQGANMGLLKTVFEVNLSLFGKSKLNNNNHKVLLLFVIRDHIGNTPKDNLFRTVTEDLIKMWDNLNKPNDLSHLKFEDFFDINFHTLSHKVLQPENFMGDIKLLGDRLTKKDELFKANYHHNIPIDGWTMYAESCWDQIDSNKDLDLPTQQVLVAKFKCDEILNSVYDEFIFKYKELFSKTSRLGEKENVDYTELGSLFVDLRNDSLEDYDISASRYNQSIYEQKRLNLIAKLNEKFTEIFDVYVNNLSKRLILEFKDNLNSLKGKKFNEVISNLTKSIHEKFENNAKLISLNNELSFERHQESLQTSLTELISKQQIIELNNIANKSLKKVNNGLTKAIQFELTDPDENTWDTILDAFNQVMNDILSKYQSEDGYDFGLGTSPETNDITVNKFKFKAWINFHEIIHKLISTDNILTLLKDRFDDKFRYDENGLPRLYQNSHEVEISFNNSKHYALKILPILSIAKLKDGSELVPEFDIFNKKLKSKYLEITDIEDTDEEDEEATCFAEVISEKDKTEILSKFKKEIDAKFIETKRSIIQHVTQIPYYIYLVILVLGWNEFLAIIRNPLFFTLLLLISAAIYIMYQLNLLKPATLVLQRLVDEVLAVTKSKLRELLLEDSPKREESIEMKELN